MRLTKTLSAFVLSTLIAISHAPNGALGQDEDWLIDGEKYLSVFGPVEGKPNQYALSNGLVKRQFLLGDGIGATVGLENTSSDTSLLRAVRPESSVTVDGVRYDVGGLAGQPNHAYLRDEWLINMKPSADALRFVKYSQDVPSERFAWKRVRHASPNTQWPPQGVKLTLEFAPKDGKAFRVFVHYEIYDGIPVFCKWITVENQSERELTINRFTSEILAVVENESRVETRDGVNLPMPDSIHVETDFAFGGFNHANANRHVVHWRTDPEYTTQVNYLKATPCMLVVEPTYGPAQTIAAGNAFESCRVFELLHDSSERERRSLSLRRMYRVIAPWVTENPLMHHMRVAEPDAVRRAIDDAAEVGFEMIILSFGSGFNIENEDPKYIQTWKDVNQYAREKKIELGGYSLLSSRRIGGGNNIVSPEGKKPTHGNCPALTSPWGQAYFKKLYQFFETTGFSVLEHDGPYPGDVDVTPRPPLQKGEQDSRWVQAKITNDFYRWCRANGIYINAPDYYYLNGTNKCGMGYREVNWSLPRKMQLIHTRQNIFDGTWSKTPSMGWMFVPLSEYHGGGEAATIEPLHEHLDHYEQMMQSNLGLGVQACFRGPRLFDTEQTREMVRRNIVWFKKYRDILESDVIHGRRADGRDLDWMLHVNPSLERKGMLLVYNPTDKPIEKTLKVNLYYTGLSDNVSIIDADGKATTTTLNRDYSVKVDVLVPANEMTWFVVQE